MVTQIIHSKKDTSSERICRTKSDEAPIAFLCKNKNFTFLLKPNGAVAHEWNGLPRVTDYRLMNLLMNTNSLGSQVIVEDDDEGECENTMMYDEMNELNLTMMVMTSFIPSFQDEEVNEEDSLIQVQTLLIREHRSGQIENVLYHDSERLIWMEDDTVMTATSLVDVLVTTIAEPPLVFATTSSSPPTHLIYICNTITVPH
ncbi:hypothetical protein Tco_0449368 [Tanacetum coccineum]